MLQFVIAGLALGGIYAIACSGLVLTYLSTGILNFAFGALAYTIARFYYYLNSELHWGIAPSAALAIFGFGPLLGVVLYFVLFRSLQSSTTLIKIVATLGVAVALPSLDMIVFGNAPIDQAPGLAPQPVRVFHIYGTAVTLDQVIVFACVVAVVVIGMLVLRYTDVGLQVRSMVDSPAMTSLSGSNPRTISLGVWAVSIGLAGLAGVLSAPIIQLDPSQFTLLMIAAFSGVIAAKLRNLPVAFFVGLAIGVVGALVQYWLPPSSSLTVAVLPSVPFIITAIFLVYFMVRGDIVDESTGVGGALDRAIKTQDEDVTSRTSGSAIAQSLSWRAPTIAFAAICLLPLLLRGFWLGFLAEGAAYGIIFLSYTMVVGEGGMIWLCQSVFAGAGGFTMALLAADHGWPVLLGMLMGGLVAVPFALALGFLVVRLGDLYVAVVTLTFGLLVENLVFSRQLFQNTGEGINVTLPQFLSGGRAFAWFTLAVFALIALINVNLRHSTSGLAMGAVRSSPLSARTLGINVVWMKVLLGGVAAFVAGVGGALLAMSFGIATSANYDVLLGLTWLAVLVTQGIRSNMAALIAGLSLTLLGGVVTTYLPETYSNYLPVLFGLGAVLMVKFPSGVLTFQARQIRAGMAHLRSTSPKTYRVLLGASSFSFVLFVVLILAVPHLWWLWLALTAALQGIGLHYFIYQGLRGGELEVPISMEPFRAESSLVS